MNEKNQYRIPAQDLCMGDPAPFGQRWEARVPLPLSEIGDLARALHSRYSEYRPGDLVNICSFDSLRWNHLQEMATFRIVSIDHNALAIVQIGEIVVVPKPAPVVVNPEMPDLKIVPLNNTFEVRDGQGNVIDLFVERKQAEVFIDGLVKAAKVPAKPVASAGKTKSGALV